MRSRSSCPHSGGSSGSIRSKTTSDGINVDEMYQIAQICRTSLIEYTVHQRSDYEDNTVTDRLPVKFLQSLRDD